MALSRTRPFLSLLALLTLTVPLAKAGVALVGETVQLTVDATKTQQKILHVHLSMPAP
jgi:hypothetical protein